MIPDTTDEYRPILENDPPKFFDRVNTPWDQVPDLEDYNKRPYLRIVRALRDLTRSAPERSGSNSQGVLILGEAGTGKTHLLMRELLVIWPRLITFFLFASLTRRSRNQKG